MIKRERTGCGRYNKAKVTGKLRIKYKIFGEKRRRTKTISMEYEGTYSGLKKAIKGMLYDEIGKIVVEVLIPVQEGDREYGGNSYTQALRRLVRGVPF